MTHRVQDPHGHTEQPIRFQGQWHDDESGLYYNRHRYYDPDTGRYITQDPIGLTGGLDLYQYVAAPTSEIDPMGLSGVYGLGGGPYSQSNAVRQAGAARAAGHLGGQILGSIDIGRTYFDMRAANTIGSDKYFHCKANCEAAQRGQGGVAAAQCISDAREWFDQNIKDDSASASKADQAANLHGRNGGAESSSADCGQICEPFRPNGLPSQY